MQKPHIKTVFVIGAGSGYDFSMPLGSDLVQRIAEELKNVNVDNGIHALSDQLKRAVLMWFESTKQDGIQDVNAALLRLSRGVHFAKSIDTLINDAQDHLVQILGKIIISTEINTSEGRVPFVFPPTGITSYSGKPLPKGEINAFVPLRRSDNKRGINGSPPTLSFNQTWFTAFFRELRAGLTLEEFQARIERTAIINFNYDRLTEHFLTVAHSQYDGISPEIAQQNLKALVHLHPYGVIAPPAMHERDVINGVAIGHLNIADIASAPNNIRTFDEGASEDQLTRIKSIMHSTENIVLLGYGFHSQNDRLLGLHATKARKVWATGIGLSDARRDLIGARIRGESPSYSTVLVKNLNCRELIDEYGDDFFEYI
jgi:hypothetical protein